MRNRNRRDPFESWYDTDTSIGAELEDASLGFAVEEAIIGFDFSSAVSLVPKGDGKGKVSEVAEGIRSVTRSPYTHAAIGAVAAVAPPFGTAAAGLMELGIGLTEAVLVIAEPIADGLEDIGDFFVGIVDPHKAARKRHREDRENGLRKMAELRAKGDRESKRTLARLEDLWKLDSEFLKTIGRPGSDAKGKETSMGVRLHKGRYTDKDLAAAKKRNYAADGTVAKMAALKKRADAGDKKAIGALATLNLVKSPLGVANANVLNAKREGVGVKDGAKSAKSKQAISPDIWNGLALAAVKVSKGLPTPKVKNPVKKPDTKKLANIVSLANEKLKGELVKVGSGLPGVFVSSKGAMVKGARMIRLDKGGEVGWVVTPKGRVVFGNWSKA